MIVMLSAPRLPTVHDGLYIQDSSRSLNVSNLILFQETLSSTLVISLFFYFSYLVTHLTHKEEQITEFRLQDTFFINTDHF